MRLLLIACAVMFALGCAQKPPEPLTTVPLADKTDYQIHQHSIALANQLTTTDARIPGNAKIAVGTFLPPAALAGAPISKAQQHIGSQLQESFITILTQLGFTVIEYRTRNAIKVSEQGDLMLSKELEQLSRGHDITYFLTGTLGESDDGYIANVRLINTLNHQVFAAATDTLPKNLFESADKVYVKDGFIERRAY